MSNKPRLKNFFHERTVFLALTMFVACLALSTVIPPLKSPDEPVHLERAYLLGKGVFVLERREGMSSGGYVDSGLLNYFTNYPSTQEKLASEQVYSSKDIRWSGDRVYDELPGSGYYFPVIYLPQAVGLLLGEWLDLTIDDSYRLARLLALGVVILLLYCAFRIFPANPLVLALLCLPMTLFQISSASIDGVSAALTTLAISTFLRITTSCSNRTVWMKYVLAISLIVLATSRVHAAPLLMLLALAYQKSKDRESLILLLVAPLLVCIWYVVVFKTLVDLRVETGESTKNIAAFYLSHPTRFLAILSATLSEGFFRTFYYQSFIGILGWLDAPLAKGTYTILGLVLFSIAVLSISLRSLRNDWLQRSALCGAAIFSVLLIFFALLVTWTPHPAQFISGVQGRYFLLPAMLLAYAASGTSIVDKTPRALVANILVFFSFVCSLTAGMWAITERYYLTDFEPVTQEMKLGFSPGDRLSLSASAPISQGSTMPLTFPLSEVTTIGMVNRVGILFGTHLRDNPGEAEIVLVNHQGNVYRRSFSLARLRDNSYKYFDVPADIYVAGKIESITGSGVSVWESSDEDGESLTCVRFQSIFRQTATVRGCP